ncbi:type II secretion system protein N [Oceaniglobus trochenteri]|uniref:type II secretion system protein N n=1 Tax=Oceaniglobus trochenteri TaxID=2763260 RepID=UPI001D00047B
MTCVSLILFLAALVATAPADSVTRVVTLPPQVVGLEGRLWRGRAVLAGGLSLEWRVLPGALVAGRLALAVDLRGPQSLATGRVYGGLRGFGAEDLSGRIGPEALTLVEADGLRCSMIAALEGVALWRHADGLGARGEVNLPAGRCSNRVAQDVAVPPLRVALSSEGVAARAAVSTGDTPLGGLRAVPEGDVVRLGLRIEPAGARLVPGLPASAASELEYLLE